MTEWRSIPGYEERYEVSDGGRVRSVVWSTPRERSLYIDARGYASVNLSRAGRHRTWRVHTLVLMAFVGPRPDGYHGCHNNGVGSDNRVENLRWDTPESNAQDTLKHGTHFQASKTHCPRGHELSGDNLLIEGCSGARRCRTCRQRQGWGRGRTEATRARAESAA